MRPISYCFDCNTMSVESKDAANEHAVIVGHDIHDFGAPDQYVSPIRLFLYKIASGKEITNNDMIMCKLAIQLGELDMYRRKQKKQ